MEITYRDLAYQDIRVLTPIMKTSFDEDTRLHTRLLEDGPSGYDNGQLLERMLRRTDAVSRVILYDDKIIGGYTISMNQDVYTLEIIFIAVEYTAKGIGYRVWQDIENKWKDAKTWVLETPSYSIRNHNFYKKCGFKVLKERSYSEESKSLVFIKHLV